METLYGFVEPKESIFLSRYTTRESRRLAEMTDMSDEAKVWLGTKIRGKKMASQNKVLSESKEMDAAIDLWQIMYSFTEIEYGSRYLASTLALDYISDLSGDISVPRYLAYKEYLGKVMKNSQLNDAFLTTLDFRIKEEKIKDEVANSTGDLRQAKKEELERLIKRRMRYQEGLKEGSQSSVCDEAVKCKRDGTLVAKEHRNVCAICLGYQPTLLITGRKLL